MQSAAEDIGHIALCRLSASDVSSTTMWRQYFKRKYHIPQEYTDMTEICKFPYGFIVPGAGIPDNLKDELSRSGKGTLPDEILRINYSVKELSLFEVTRWSLDISC